MKLRDQVLEALEKNRGDYCSGEALSAELGVSRNAVWKAIRQLKEAGHDIHGASNKGYRLAPGSSILSPQGVGQYLKHPLTLEVYPELPSTNSFLKQRAEAGAPEGLVVFAERQSAGRGRRGHSFYSPPGGGIYMSLLLRPGFSAQESLCITTCAAVAVCEAIEELSGEETRIKWVNDVFCRGKKVCGISTEASLDLESGGLHYAILGIGINVFPGATPIPPELENVITTVFSRPDTGQDLRSKLAAGILNRFFDAYPRLTQKAYFDAYRARSLVLGKPVFVLRGEGRREATALDLTPDFCLQVRYPDGSEEALSSGEVSVRVAP